MDDKQHAKRETGIRMRDFGVANPLSGNALFTQLNAQLVQLMLDVNEIAANEEASDGAAREATATRETARDALRERLEAISRTARAIAATRPGFADQFQVPPGDNDGELINAGLAFARRATPEVAAFVSYGMAANFIDDLRADVAALQAAMAGQTERVADRKAAGVQLDEKFDEMMVLRRHLDALYKNVHRDDAAILSLWTSAKHIARRRRSAAPPEPTPPPPPTPSA